MYHAPPTIFFSKTSSAFRHRLNSSEVTRIQTLPSAFTDCWKSWKPVHLSARQLLRSDKQLDKRLHTPSQKAAENRDLASPRLERILLVWLPTPRRTKAAAPGSARSESGCSGGCRCPPRRFPHYNERRGEFPAAAGARPATFSSPIFLSGRADGSVASSIRPKQTELLLF